MFRPISTFSRKATLVAALVFCPAVGATAQPTSNQMCGDGTGGTFTVTLPHVSTGTGGHDTIEVPRGCSIYLIIASDYGRNRQFDELLFYPLAKYVAEHNGYVHYSWWNNFLKPYMGGVLHSKDKPTDPGPKATIGMLTSVFGLEVPVGLPGNDEVYINDLVSAIPTLGGLPALWEQFTVFVSNTVVHVPTDQQFVSDATYFIEAVRTNSPNALIFLAGHGFGAHAIVKVARNPENTIDLLALIDPIGNETSPLGHRQLFERNPNPFIDEVALFGTYGHTAPHSRWRAVFDFKGYQQADCIRGDGPGGLLCKDFDTQRFWVFEYHCKKPEASLWEPKPPLVPSLKPLICPGPLVDPGTRISLGANVGFLYHRYQQEWGPPVDFGSAHHYGFRAPVTKRSPVTNKLEGPNVQGPVLREDIIVQNHPFYTGGARTCRDSDRGCQPADGHDEIAGFRGKPTFPLGAGVVLTLSASGVKARDWPSDPVSNLAFLRASDTSPNSEARRLAMIEMASTTANLSDFNCAWDTRPPGFSVWSHSPCTPEDCMLCEDLVEIATDLVAKHNAENPPPVDTTAPSTLATVEPGANANGWHQADVVVTIQADDDAAGSGVREIRYSTPAGGTIEQGSVAKANITQEGTTTLSFFAIDNANNSGTPNSIELKIDKTLPEIEALTDPQPNSNGWFKTDVTVSFAASDQLSGIASVTPDTVITGEGAELEAEGTAADNADNQKSVALMLSIDKTAPTIAFAGKTPAANAAGWHAGNVTVSWNCADSLSGPVATAVMETVTTEGAAQTAVGTCLDLADNAATDAQGGINIDKTAPSVTISAPGEGAVLLLNAPITSAYACSDSLSGVFSCHGPSASGAALDTSSVGSRHFTVHASDVAGNVSSATISYAVQYAFTGFGHPIAPTPMRNIVNAGRTVPVKYGLRDASGAPITDLSTFVSLHSAASPCDPTASGAPAEETDAAGSTEIRWDAASNQFLYNWKTEKAWAGTCRMLQLTLDDGTQHVALFQFK